VVALIHLFGCRGIVGGQSVSYPRPGLARDREIHVTLGDKAHHVHAQDQDLLGTHGGECTDVDP